MPQGVADIGLFENGDGYPHFTRGEWNDITRQIARRGYMDPSKMGSGWTDFGPKVRILMYCNITRLIPRRDIAQNMIISGNMRIE